MEPESPAPSANVKRPRGRRFALGLGAVLAVTLTVCYRLQPDILAPVTLVPPLCWVIAGALLLTFGCGRDRLRLALVAAVCWLLFAALVVDELPGLLRMATRAASTEPADDEGRTLRVVSLNCHVGRASVAAEVGRCHPDIVLLQESPPRDVVERLAGEMFGDQAAVVWQGDTSIICRGTLRDAVADPRAPFALATLVLPDGYELEVASVRLDPPVFWIDFWTRSWWIAHRDKRRQHRAQIAALLAALDERNPARPAIVGGDMNSPANDAALWGLRGRFVDTFARAGSGWGNTGPSSLPFWRVDQIWASPPLAASRVIVRTVADSDHRIVICDLGLPPR